MNINTKENNPHRFTKLDGLRGLLSLVVCLNHSFMVVTIPAFANVWQQNPFIFHGLQSKIQQLFMLIGNGGAAVTLFFLLSGLVLGQSLSRVKMSLSGLTGFILKRLVRLYPVYLLILVLTALYMKFGFTYETYPFSSSWFNWWMNFRMTLNEFFYNLFFIHAYIGGVTWTLRVILITSFIFPIFFLINQKTSKWQDIFISGLLVFLSFTLLNIEGFRDLRYLYMFYLGLMIPKFQQLFTTISNRYFFTVFPFALIILLGFRYLTDEYRGGVIESLISFFIIGFSAYGAKINGLRFLEGRLLTFFGKISYSLYLIHFSVLYLISKLMFQNFPNLPYRDNYLLIHLVLFIFSTALATLIATFIYRLVELPSLRLAKSIGQKFTSE